MITEEMLSEYFFVLLGLLVIVALLAAIEVLIDGFKWLVKKGFSTIYRKRRSNRKDEAFSDD